MIYSYNHSACLDFNVCIFATNLTYLIQGLSQIKKASLKIAMATVNCGEYTPKRFNEANGNKN